MFLSTIGLFYPQFLWISHYSYGKSSLSYPQVAVEAVDDLWIKQGRYACKLLQSAPLMGGGMRSLESVEGTLCVTRVSVSEVLVEG